MDEKSFVEPIEIYRYEPVPDKPGYLRYVGNRSVREVFAELKERLKAEDLLPDEYFNLVYQDSLIRPECEKLEFPRYRWIACYAVTGDSEGYYIHIDALVPRRDLNPPLYESVPIILGKTFQGMEFAQAVAAACARHLGA